jgi:hypothetical protein
VVSRLLVSGIARAEPFESGQVVSSVHVSHHLMLSSFVTCTV